ncbi:hypothetical protein [Mycobacterium phage Azrael100]|nr:hypothetical protein [Mycobacterium phage Azrael100]
MIELAKIRYGKESEHMAVIDLEPHRGNLSVWNAEYMSPDEFKELAQAMIRAAQAAPGVVEAWRKQQADIAAARDRFESEAAKFGVA